MAILSFGTAPLIAVVGTGTVAMGDTVRNLPCKISDKDEIKP